MAIETATYLAELQPLYPLLNDPISSGDDHLRLIKQVMQNTFPGRSGAEGRSITKSTTFTPSLTEIGVQYYVDTAVTVTLPDAATAPAGAGWTITAAAAVTVQAAGGQTIYGAASISLVVGDIVQITKLSASSWSARWSRSAPVPTVAEMNLRALATGSNASGSWPISVTGSSASCTGNSATASQATNATNVNGGAVAASSMSLTNTAPTMSFADTDWGTMSVHCNGGSIGFLTSGGGWAARTDNAGNWTATANVIAYSDARLKKAWKKLPKDFVSRLSLVKSGTYLRKDVKELGRQVGVSAQELAQILPEAVFESGGVLGISYGNAALSACIELAKAVVELQAEVRRLKEY